MGRPRSIFLVAIAALCFAALTEAPRAQTSKERPAIQATEVSVSLEAFDKPFVRRDERGKRRTYTQAYLVRLKGHFGEAAAIPLDVFIGDYAVPEYGSTREGVYFRIYDEALLDRLAGQPIGYGFQGQRVGTFDLRFPERPRRPKGWRPPAGSTIAPGSHERGNKAPRNVR